MVNQMIRIPEGCVLWLDLTEDTGNVLYDRSGHGNNGAVSGAVLEKRKPFWGRFFDGVDDYVEVPYSSDFDLKELTIVALVNLFGKAVTGDWRLDNNGIFAKRENYKFVITWKGVLTFGFFDTADTWHAAYSDPAIEWDKWNFVGVSFKRPNVTFCINDIYEHATLDYEIRVEGTLSEYIGKTWNNEPSWGVFAHLSVYNRALTRGELKILYEELQKRVLRRIEPLNIHMR